MAVQVTTSIDESRNPGSGINRTHCDHCLETIDQGRFYVCGHPHVVSQNGVVPSAVCSACPWLENSIHAEPDGRTTIHVTLTTYNRGRMLKDVLDDIYETGRDYNVLVDVYDDASTDDLSFLEDFQNLRHFRRSVNGGVPGFWHLIDAAVSRIRSIEADYYVFLQDDMRLVPDFFTRAIDVFESIDDPLKSAVNLLLDQSREGKACWTQFQPQRERFRHHEVWLTQWTDCCFLAARDFFVALDFRIDPVSAKRWISDPERSSGVGEQISCRLVKAGKRLYQVSGSLVRHGSHTSHMFPELRRREPLIAVPDEPVIAGLATIPSRADILPQVVASILSQVDELHVYLNGYSYVPECLQHPIITSYLSSEHAGDLGDAGKFYTVGQRPAYYFSIDDDLCYPSDYVSTLLQKIEEYDRTAVVGLHGITLHEQVESYYRDRQLNHCLLGLDNDRVVHLLGTGVAAFHTQTLNLSISDFPQPNMADIWLGLSAQRQQVQMTAIAHKADWLELLPVSDAIFERHRQDDSIQTELVNSIPEWKLVSGREPDSENLPVVKPRQSNAPAPSTLDSYATHLPFLQFLVSTFAPQSVIEFGMGFHSTPLLIESGAHVVSIEADHDWWMKTQTRHSKHRAILWPNDNVQDYLLQYDRTHIDLAFVDGPEKSRVPCVQRLFGRARLIVIHDSFTRCYGWGKLVVPDEYRRFDYRELTPDTSVFASDPADWPLIERFLQTPSPAGAIV